MRKMSLFILLSALWFMPACHNPAPTETPVKVVETDTIDTIVGTTTTLYDTLNIDSEVVVKENCFIVISKQLTILLSVTSSLTIPAGKTSQSQLLLNMVHVELAMVFIQLKTKKY